MTAFSLFKQSLKILIIILFLTDRLWQYSDLKYNENSKDYNHSEIFGMFNIDPFKVEQKYFSHQIFYLPMMKKALTKFKDFVCIDFTKDENNKKFTHYLSSIFNRYRCTHSKSDIQFEFSVLVCYDFILCFLIYIMLKNDLTLINIGLIINYLLQLYSLIF